MPQRKDALGRPLDARGRVIRKDTDRSLYGEALNPRKKEVRQVTLIQQIKQFDIDRMDVDDAIALSAQARQLEAEYSGFGAEMDDRLKDKIDELRTFIKASQKALIQKRLREARARKQALLPRDQKIANLDTEIAELEKKLAE